eukprot:6403133-Prorocentrum_lima.AAC.1
MQPKELVSIRDRRMFLGVCSSSEFLKLRLNYVKDMLRADILVVPAFQRVEMQTYLVSMLFGRRI